ncbi:MAG: helix-turn-helix transcriptional regulator [Clostridia bacterium]|nr:helix-turn-helix transcriptional regulator [Clostridia bacterium]
MTVGQRIQEHRKKNGLSQEELGQRLLVSRQTVSLWEKDQTLPTVDNLLLLKEIFGISVDELLGEEKKEEKPSLERWEITYRQEALKEMLRRKLWARLLLGILLSVLGVGLLWEGYLFGDRLFAAAVLFAGGALLFHFGSALKRRKYRLQTLPESKLSLALYEEELTIALSRGEGADCVVRSPYGALRQIRRDGSCYVICYEGKEFLIPLSLFEKGEYDPETRLEAFLKKQEAQYGRKKPTGALRISALLLCISTYLGFAVLDFMSGLVLVSKDPYTVLTWTVIGLSLVSAGSVGMGIYLLCKNKKGLHNLIVGAILLYGALRFAFVMPDSIEFYQRFQVDKEEEIADLGIDLPPIEAIFPVYEGGGFVDGVAHFSTQNVQFKVQESIDFESGLPDDPAWMTELPAELLPISVGTMEFDYLSIYNITTGEFNTLPSESGTYQFLRVAYRAGRGVLDRYAVVYEAESSE